MFPDISGNFFAKGQADVFRLTCLHRTAFIKPPVVLSAAKHLRQATRRPSAGHPLSPRGALSTRGAVLEKSPHLLVYSIGDLP